MSILFVNDNSFNQEAINGVLVTTKNLIKELTELGHTVDLISPDDFKFKFDYPFYKGIFVTIPYLSKHLRAKIKSSAKVIIQTEGPIGLAVRNFCVANGIPYYTFYHTRFPEYIQEYYGISAKLTIKYFTWFHSKAVKCFVPTEELAVELGWKNITVLARGVDTNLFYPDTEENEFAGMLRPIKLYVGRVSKEKNIEEFLNNNILGSNVVIGDGPEFEYLMNKYPSAHFLGRICQQELRYYYSNADVTVFPSKTDTFGLTNLEAMACGCPVAMLEDSGVTSIVPSDFIGIGKTIDDAITKALTIGRSGLALITTVNYSWKSIALKLLDLIK